MRPGGGPTLALIPADRGAAITGPVADVAALVEHLHATGATLTTVPGRAGNDLRITLPATPAVPARARLWRPGTAVPQAKGHRPGWFGWSRGRVALALTAAVLAITAVAGLVWLVWLAVAWLIAHLAAVGAFLAVLAVVSVAGGGACVTTVRITHHH